MLNLNPKFEDDSLVRFTAEALRDMKPMWIGFHQLTAEASYSVCYSVIDYGEPRCALVMPASESIFVVPESYLVQASE